MWDVGKDFLRVPGDGNSASFQRFSSTHPFSNFGRIIECQSTAESEYDGVTVEINKRFSGNWQAKLAYTLGKVTDTRRGCPTRSRSTGT